MHFVPAASSSLSLAPPQSTSVTSASTNATGAAAVAIGSDDDDYHGFDLNSGRSWIYPTNYPEREYQFKIVESSLYENTLVTLPTGLGKTFIAAVVMYNYFRWFPLGKIVFMAPTKPLVAQQIEACFNIMGVPQIEVSCCHV
jgi:superfamily II DNA or RNA helicase